MIEMMDFFVPIITNLSYTFYTSGTTGKPKGVMIIHEAFCNNMLWMQKEYKILQSDKMLQKTSICFDVSTWELFWPFIVGAQLIISRSDKSTTTTTIMNYHQQQRTTTTRTTK